MQGAGPEIISVTKPVRIHVIPVGNSPCAGENCFVRRIKKIEILKKSKEQNLDNKHRNIIFIVASVQKNSQI